MKKLSTFFLLTVFSLSAIAVAQDDAVAPAEDTQQEAVQQDVDTQDSPSDVTVAADPVPMESTIMPVESGVPMTSAPGIAMPMNSVVGSGCGCGTVAPAPVAYSQPVMAAPVSSCCQPATTCAAACPTQVSCCQTSCVTKCCSTKRVRTKRVRVRNCRPRRCRCR